jgi:hypothetical protein
MGIVVVVSWVLIHVVLIYRSGGDDDDKLNKDKKKTEKKLAGKFKGPSLDLRDFFPPDDAV